jgi:hypothetical protein
MKIYAVLAGRPEPLFAVDAEPHDTITTMLAEIAQDLLQRGLPSEFTAYSAKQNGRLELDLDTLDFYALQFDEPEAIARYITPAAQLEPTKTVADYFGTAADTEKIAIVVYWTVESWRQCNDQLERAAAINATQTATTARSDEPVVPSTQMKLLALVVGNQDFVFGVDVKPHDTIATMLDMIAQRYSTRLGPRHGFTVCSAKRSGQWPVRFDAFDFYALMFGDPAAVSRYITPDAQLDPTKTVSDYFGTTSVDDTIQLLVSRSPTPSTTPDEDDQLVCAHIETDVPNKTGDQALEPRSAAAAALTGSLCHASVRLTLAWQSVWACFSAISCRPHATTSCLDATAKKNN